MGTSSGARSRGSPARCSTERPRRARRRRTGSRRCGSWRRSSSPSPRARRSTSAAEMRLAIFARTFTRDSVEAVLDAVAAHGLDAAQFNPMLLGGASLPESLPPGDVDRVAAAHAARGIAMIALSGTYNMAHPDAERRAEGARRLARLIAVAPRLGTRVVTLCTGTRDPGDMWRAHPANASP